MMKRILFATCMMFPAAAFTEGLSAIRDPNVSYKFYVSRMQTKQTVPGSAADRAVPLRELDESTIPVWPNFQEIVTGFEMLRDFRFLNQPTNRKFLRRETWLYPDDGCFARATLARRNLQDWNFKETKKLFAFGNLTVQTANAQRGQVSWWYHVVPVAMVGRRSYVFDPAIEPSQPLSLEDWVGRMGGAAADIKLAVCDGGTYVPSDSCRGPSASAESSALDDQISFLDQEWKRLLLLQRQPEKELGETPPWSAANPE
jgi:hypothetical protein